MTENSQRFLIDSNILVYAFDSSAAKKHEKAKDFVAEKIKSKNLFLSIQNLAEFSATITEKVKKPLLQSQAEEIISDFNCATNIVSYYFNTVQSALSIKFIHKVHFWDALIAATMKENNIKLIFTENVKDFKKIHEIRVINPLDFDDFEKGVENYKKRVKK